MLLYHLTCEIHLSNIVRERRLRTTTADLDVYGNGPAVVWLTTDGTADQEWQHIEEHTPARARKNRVRFTVELPDHEPQVWVRWAKRHGADMAWIAILVETGGVANGGTDWHVVTRPIPWREWRRIEVLNDEGEWSTLWDKADGSLHQLDGMLPGFKRQPAPKPALPALGRDIIKVVGEYIRRELP